MPNTAKRRDCNPARHTEAQPKQQKATIVYLSPRVNLEELRQRIEEKKEKAIQCLGARVFPTPEDQNNIDRRLGNSLDEKQELPLTKEDGLPRLEQLEQKLSELMAEAAKLPPQEQVALFEKFQEAADARLREIAELTKKPDISHIPLWGGKIKDGPAIEWLDKHYGDYLTTFRAKENRLYRQDIKAHDPKLVRGIDHEAYKANKGPREFLPAKLDEVNDRAKNLGLNEQGRAVKGSTDELLNTIRVLQSRTYRRKNAKRRNLTPT